MFYGISMFYDHLFPMDDRMQRNRGYRAVAQDSLCQGSNAGALNVRSRNADGGK